MAVRLSEQRNFDIQEQEKFVAELKEAILGAEYAERLAAMPEWETLKADYRKAFHKRADFDIDGAKERLCTQPMKPEAAVELREQVMLYERDRVNLEDFLGYPERVKTNLKDLRRELDAAEVKLKKLKGEDHG